MKTHSTDQLLTLGMALTTDKKAMERRVRGVFARKTSAKSVIALSLVLALTIGVAAFTTACQPGQGAQTLTPIPVEQEKSDIPQGENTEGTSAVASQSGTEPLRNPAKELLDSAFEVPGAVPVSVTHITQPSEPLPAGIEVLVDAELVIPQTTDYRIRECKQTSFTLDEYRKMLDYFFPNGKGKPNQEVKGVQADGTFDLKNLDLETGTPLYMQKGSDVFSLNLGGKNSVFWMERENEIIYQEGDLVGDKEWEQEVGEIIRAPISLTRDAALAQAQKVISDLDIQDWQIESIQRAISIDWNHPDTVLGRGWAFVYGLSDAGLTMHQANSFASDKHDQLSYWKVDAGVLTIYVDERGVSDFHWEKRYQPSNVMYSSQSIISAEDALKLAKERIARIYGELGYEDSTIEIFDIRLSTVLIGYSDRLTGQPFPDPYEDIALLIPTWNFSFRLVHGGGSEEEYFTMPFSAIDGGAVSMLRR